MLNVVFCMKVSVVYSILLFIVQEDTNKIACSVILITPCKSIQVFCLLSVLVFLPGLRPSCAKFKLSHVQSDRRSCVFTRILRDLDGFSLFQCIVFGPTTYKV